MNTPVYHFVKRSLTTGRFVLFFCGPGMLYHYLKKRRAWRRLEEYAEDKGAERTRTDSVNDFGELRWMQSGRPVRVRICHDNPSFGPWISLGLKLDDEMLFLKTYTPITRPRSEWVMFNSGVEDFDRLYRTRQIRMDYGEKVDGAEEVFRRIVQFHYDWLLYLAADTGCNGLDINGEYVRCTLGPSIVRSTFPYITPEEIEALLPDMLRIADCFDSAFS